MAKSRKLSWWNILPYFLKLKLKELWWLFAIIAIEALIRIFFVPYLVNMTQYNWLTCKISGEFITLTLGEAWLYAHLIILTFIVVLWGIYIIWKTMIYCVKKISEFLQDNWRMARMQAYTNERSQNAKIKKLMDDIYSRKKL